MFKLIIEECEKCQQQKECVLIEDPHHNDETWGRYDLVVLCESCLQEELKLPKEVIKDPLNEKEWLVKHDGT